MHFVPVSTTTDLGGSYTPATLRPEDYPELIEAGRPIATLAVGSVLVAYNWPAGTERYRKVANFVRVFFDRLHDLQAPPHHPKWRDIDLVAEVPGWIRFAPAEQWIRKAGLDYGAPPRRADLDGVITQRRAAALSPQERDVFFTEFCDYQRRQHYVTGSAGLLDPRQRDALFREFVDYQERQTREANRAGSLDPRQRDALSREFVDYQKGQTHEANSAGSLDLRQRDSLFAEFVDYSKH